MSGIDPIVLTGLRWPSEVAGGLNRMFAELSEGLIQSGESVQAVVIGPADGAPAYVTAVGDAANSFVSRLRAMRAIRNQVNAGRLIDVHMAVYALPVVVGNRGRPPIVVHFQGPWADEVWVEGDHSRLRRRVRRYAERLVYQRAKAVIVLCDEFAERLVDDYKIPRNRIHVLPPGVDLERFQPQSTGAVRHRFGLPDDGPIVLTVRRLAARMGLDVLLQAWRLAHPQIGGHLYIAGKGALRRDLEEMVERLHIAESVHFLGFVSDDDLPHWYAAADVTIVPTVELEGYGLVVLESLASGTPAIASSVGGLREALPKLRSDLLVPPGDASRLAERLVDAFLNETLPERAECRELAEGYSWAQVALETRRIYQTAL